MQACLEILISSFGCLWSALVLHVVRAGIPRRCPLSPEKCIPARGAGSVAVGKRSLSGIWKGSCGLRFWEMLKPCLGDGLMRFSWPLSFES
jgi:hypothetical protein